MAYETRLGAGIRQLGDVDSYRMLRGKDLDITEADALTSLADADIFLVDDDAAGTQASTKKITAANLKAYVNLGNAATATLATTVTSTANDSTDETVYITFVDGQTAAQDIETDVGLTYNPGLGKLTCGWLQTLQLQSTGSIACDSTVSCEDSLTITTDSDGTTGGILNLKKFRGTTTAADNDEIGEIKFSSKNDAGSPGIIGYASIQAEIADVTDGSEAGRLNFKVAEFDGTVTSGLILNGDTDANGEVDVTIGAGAASTTTIAGTLTMGSTAAMTNAGLLSVGNQTGITGVGTISSGTWQGSDVAVAYGGTGVSTFSSGQILYGDGANPIADATNITTDGSWLTAQVGGFKGKTLLDTTYVSEPGRSQGTIITFGLTTSMTAGAVYFLDGIGGWQLANADTPSSGIGMMGLALGTASGVHGMLLNGIGETSTDSGDMGDVLYLAAANGRLSSTAPSSSGDIVRVMGYSLHDTSKLVYFNPSGTWVEIA